MCYICDNCDSQFQKRLDLKKHIDERHSQKLSCNICGDTFSKNHELEEHMLNTHKEVKQFSCDQCDMSFVLQWRLKKHVKEHQQLYRRRCHYYNNNKDCPFSKIGCKFIHDIAPECTYGSTCSRTKCQYQHSQ